VISQKPKQTSRNVLEWPWDNERKGSIVGSSAVPTAHLMVLSCLVLSPLCFLFLVEVTGHPNPGRDTVKTLTPPRGALFGSENSALGMC